MNWRRYTFWALVVGVFGYEFYAILSGHRGDTVSAIMWSLSGGKEQHSLVPFAMGFLMGHFFFPKG